MAEQTADDSIAILKAVIYGTPKELVPELQTPGGMKFHEKLKMEYALRDMMWDIPSDGPELTNFFLEKFDYDAPKRLRKSSKCPACTDSKLISIVYGLPEGELIAQSERVEVELGGCSVTEVFDPERGFISGDPELYCPKCEGRFFSDNARNKA